MSATLRRLLLASTSPMALHLGAMNIPPGYWRAPRVRMAEPKPGAFKPISKTGLYDYNP